MGNSGKLSVAIHLRRGDLNKRAQRHTPDRYYLRLADVVRKTFPTADIHLWSSTDVQAGPQWWKSEDFDVYRKRGIEVHLDDDTLLEPWAHMARAHILIMSISTFSYVPA